MNVTIMLIITVILGVIGDMIFKIGTNKNPFGKLTINNFFDLNFYKSALTSPWGWIIALSLIVNLISKLLLMIPWSTERFAFVTAIVSPMVLTLTIVFSYVVFKDSYSTREIIGMVTAIVAVIILSWK